MMKNENKHFTENDRIFFSDGFKLAQSAIDQGLSNSTLFSAIESMYAAIDALVDKLDRQIIKHKEKSSNHR